jgi:biotin-(acetyl-CoA carboxylase) ligase
VRATVGASIARPHVQAEQQSVSRFVIGIGINVNRPAEGAFERAIYISDATNGSDVALQPIAESVSSAVIAACNAWQNANFDFSSLAFEYDRQLSILGDDITVKNSVGAIIASGTVQGVDPRGYLLLDNEGFIQTVNAGEVTLRS